MCLLILQRFNPFLFWGREKFYTQIVTSHKLAHSNILQRWYTYMYAHSTCSSNTETLTQCKNVWTKFAGGTVIWEMCAPCGHRKRLQTSAAHSQLILLKKFSKSVRREQIFSGLRYDIFHSCFCYCWVCSVFKKMLILGKFKMWCGCV